MCTRINGICVYLPCVVVSRTVLKATQIRFYAEYTTVEKDIEYEGFQFVSFICHSGEIRLSGYFIYHRSHG